MRAIYKYRLAELMSDVEMPKGARVLSAQVQQNKICVWVDVDISIDSFNELHSFRLIATGEHMNDDFYLDFEHIDTVQIVDAAVVIVLHVYKKKLAELIPF